MPSTDVNPYLSDKGRRILQQMNALNVLLEHDEVDGHWTIGTDDADHLSGACGELMRLCLLETEGKIGNRKRYKVAGEGQRVLINPKYKPKIIEAIERDREELRANRPKTTEELHSKIK